MEPNNPADASLAAPLQADDVSTPYEFGAEENDVFRSLGQTMSVVGLVLVALGSLSLIQGIIVFTHLFAVTPGVAYTTIPAYILQVIGFLLLGIWTRNAGRHFALVATADGADVPPLMKACTELLEVYRLQTILIVSAIALTLLMVLRWSH
jgi:hypothetical protein